MKVTINPLKNENVEIAQWNVSDEPPRLSVDTEDYSYSIVMAAQPYVEVWTLDQNKELSQWVMNIPLSC